MAYSELDYRFSPRRVGQAPETQPQTMAEEMSRQIHVLGNGKAPNRKSAAKKKWWADKRAREAAEGK